LLNQKFEGKMETNIDIVIYMYSGVNRVTRAQVGVIGFINQPKT